MTTETPTQTPNEGTPTPVVNEAPAPTEQDNSEKLYPSTEPKQEEVKEEAPKEDPAKEEIKKDENEQPKKIEGAPEKYEDFTIPEGMKPDPQFQSTIAEWSRDFNLSQEQGQQLADKAAAVIAKAGERQAAAMQELQTKWVDELKNDKDFGGDKFDANLAQAKKVESLLSKEYVKILTDTGLINHPEVVKQHFSLGKSVSEDSIVVTRSNGDPKANQDPASKLYPSMKK